MTTSTLQKETVPSFLIGTSYRQNLVSLLSQDLDFHQQDSKYASHNFHSFPAKFPPQLPRKFIQGLTEPGAVVLDPMMGSGTTILEAYLTGRAGIGFDIDPLAIRLTRSKVTPLDIEQTRVLGRSILENSTRSVDHERDSLERTLKQRWDEKTKEFVDYWFAHETQIELLALMNEIEAIGDEDVRTFFELVFSGIIITKSGGVSLAFDLGHTRPHRAKMAQDEEGNIVIGKELKGHETERVKLLTKTLRSPLREFDKRFRQNLASIQEISVGEKQLSLFENASPTIPRIRPSTMLGDAQALTLGNDSVDLIVTSPPYAANAIDYMRAHKFSLVWMEYAVDDLGQMRKEYIGGEAVSDFEFEKLPQNTRSLVERIAQRDEKRGRVLHRYYSEMTRAISEMHRVLKPGRAALVVVGNSIMRGQDTETQNCLAEIGELVGFQVPAIGVRRLDRNRRMMPAGFEPDLNSQIQQRMHEEYVIGFLKPDTVSR